MRQQDCGATKPARHRPNRLHRNPLRQSENRSAISGGDNPYRVARAAAWGFDFRPTPLTWTYGDAGTVSSPETPGRREAEVGPVAKRSTSSQSVPRGSDAPIGPDQRGLGSVRPRRFRWGLCGRNQWCTTVCPCSRVSMWSIRRCADVCQVPDSKLGPCFQILS